MALFTAEELATQIAAYKSALLALATSAEYTIDVGGQRTTVRKADLPELRKTLEWLQTESDKLAAVTASEPTGRTYAKQGGTGRW